MQNSRGISKVYPESFKANLYSTDPFRMIGLIDVDIIYTYGQERVTLPFFRSSGTNSGKIKGLWYPIVGIKTHTGRFKEFTPFLNFVLSNTTRDSRASEGWLAKSLFFDDKKSQKTKIRGFSSGMYHNDLLKIGELLRALYEKGQFKEMNSLDSEKLNHIVTAKKIYPGNNHTQRENFENFIEDIFKGY